MLVTGRYYAYLYLVVHNILANDRRGETRKKLAQAGLGINR
jgi:hypothetical protein